jgi:hypothetical protein
MIAVTKPLWPLRQIPLDHMGQYMSSFGLYITWLSQDVYSLVQTAKFIVEPEGLKVFPSAPLGNNLLHGGRSEIR